MIHRAATGAGLSLGVIGLILSPAVMDKLDANHVFWLLLVALVLTSLGQSIIPAWRNNGKEVYRRPHYLEGINKTKKDL